MFRRLVTNERAVPANPYPSFQARTDNNLRINLENRNLSGIQKSVGLMRNENAKSVSVQNDPRQTKVVASFPSSAVIANLPTPASSQELIPPPPPPKSQSIYANINKLINERKSSLPTKTSGFSNRNEDNGEPPPLPIKLNSKCSRSLQDLSENGLQNNSRFFSHGPVYYTLSPMHPRPYFVAAGCNNGSLHNSVEDIHLRCDKNFVDSKTLTKETEYYPMAPCRPLQIPAYAEPQMIPWSPMVPYNYYHPFAPSPLPYGYPLPSPPCSVHSMSIKNRSNSIGQLSNASSMKLSDSNQDDKAQRLEVPLHDSSPPTSDSEQKTDQFSTSSVFDDDDNNENDSDNEIEKGCKWQCRHCTFVNNSATNICNMCCKTNRKQELKEGIKKDNEITKLNIEEKSNIKTNKDKKDKSRKNESNTNNDSPEEIIFDDKFIQEQQEIEREFRRRIENEKRIERLNKKVEEKEEILSKSRSGQQLTLVERQKLKELDEDIKEADIETNPAPNDVEKKPRRIFRKTGQVEAWQRKHNSNVDMR